MANRTVVIGETGSCRYIGVKPPLDNAEAERICLETVLPDWVELPNLGYTQVTQVAAPDHTEFGYDASFGLDWLGQATVDNSTAQVAKQIAGLLRAAGDEVAVLEGVFPTGFQTSLFSEAYFDMSRVTAYFKAAGSR